MGKNNNNLWIIAGVAVIAGVYFKWDSIKNLIQGSIVGTTEIKKSSPLWIDQSAEAKKFVQPGEEAILAKIVQYDSDLAIQQTILEKSVSDNMPLKQEIYEYAKGTLAKVVNAPINPTIPVVVPKVDVLPLVGHIETKHEHTEHIETSNYISIPNNEYWGL
tara:strand:+ start:22553 stop:23035 length:483 start_codon:yes stop_codon:yes gene_type:complete